MERVMRERIVFFLIGLLAGIILLFFFTQFFVAPSVLPVFSPENGDEIIEFIDGTQQSLDIGMYLFTSQEVYDAIVRAHERGVRIRILLEPEPMNNANDAMYAKLAAEGISVKFYSGERLHAKFIIRDGKEVLVGSHNFSYSALNKNREASVIFSGSAVQEFIDVFEEDWLWAATPSRV